jgi:hypothetical protein
VRSEASNQGDVDLSSNRQPARTAILAGPFEVEITVRYLGVEVDDALEIAEKVAV